MASDLTAPQAIDLFCDLPWTKEKVVMMADAFDPPLKSMVTGYVAYLEQRHMDAWDAHKEVLQSLRLFRVRLRGNRWICGAIEDPAKIKKTSEAILISRAATSEIVVPVPAGLSYRPFQLAGIEYARSHQGVLFGDEMGLGKTIQAIGVMNDCPQLRRVMVVCPAYLKLNWKDELEKWMVNRRPIMVIDSDNVERIRESPDQKTQNMPLRWPHCTDQSVVFIVNYEILHRFKHVPAVDLLICDEAHFLKNLETLRTKAVLDIKQGRTLTLTGTPALNRPIELYPLVKLCMREKAPGYWKFAEWFCGAKKAGMGGKGDVKGCTNPLKLQQFLRKNFMVRRLKKQVLTELPAKQRQVIELPPTNEIKMALNMEQGIWALHEDSLAELRLRRDEAEIAGDDESFAEISKSMAVKLNVAFHEMAKIRVQLSGFKVPFVEEHVRDASHDNEDKFIVFFYHKEAAKAFAKSMEDCGMQPLLIHGDIAMEDRAAHVKEFQNNPKRRVIIGTIGAMGTGVTLTASSTVIMAELDWRPGILAQAEDRAHRIGQKDSVLCQYFLFADSVDSKMIGSIIEKMENLSKILDGEGQALTEAKKAKERGARKKHDWEADAKDMTTDHIRHIHEGFRIMAGMDKDFARQRNGVGFSRFDAGIGHRFAEKGSLTKREAAFGKHLLKKYHRQLPADMLQRMGIAVNNS